MSGLFLTWQDTRSRRWYPVGRLDVDAEHYRFVYTRGAREALEHADFKVLIGFPNLDQEYELPKLFPFFSNRLLPRERDDYREFVEWLDASAEDDAPLPLLSRSGGSSVTDSFGLFPVPEPDEQGQYRIVFFAHGLRHLPQSSRDRVLQLAAEDDLLLCWDFQNPQDENALILRTNGQTDGDCHVVGFVPRYFAPDILALKLEFHEPLDVRVVRVNPPPAPQQMRLLCRLTANWPAGFAPCSSDDYQPIPQIAPHPQ